MSKFWNDRLKIGVAEIDHQHKEFVEKMEQFQQACRQGKGQQELTSMVKEIEFYVGYHFQAEEKLQKQFNYPKYKHHKQIHEMYANQVKKLKEHFVENGTNISITLKFQSYLADLLIKHINGEDKEFGKFLADNNLVESIAS